MNRETEGGNAHGVKQPQKIFDYESNVRDEGEP